MGVTGKGRGFLLRPRGRWGCRCAGHRDD